MADRPYLVLTLAPAPGEAPYLANRDKFPAAPLLTNNLHEARIWRHWIGAQRYVGRNSALVAMGVWRAVKVDPVKGAEAVKAQEQPADAAPPVIPHTGPGKVRVKPIRKAMTARTTKLNPNKRPRRAKRLRAVNAVRAKLGRPRAKRRHRKATAGV